MKKLLIGTLLLASIASANALEFSVDNLPIECMKDDVLTIVISEFGEQIFIRDMEKENQRMSMWVNPETRSWTIVLTDALKKEHCIIAFGNSLQYKGEW